MIKSRPFEGRILGTEQQKVSTPTELKEIASAEANLAKLQRIRKRWGFSRNKIVGAAAFVAGLWLAGTGLMVFVQGIGSVTTGSLVLSTLAAGLAGATAGSAVNGLTHLYQKIRTTKPMLREKARLERAKQKQAQKQAQKLTTAPSPAPQPSVKRQPPPFLPSPEPALKSEPPKPMTPAAIAASLALESWVAQSATRPKAQRSWTPRKPGT